MLWLTPRCWGPAHLCPHFASILQDNCVGGAQHYGCAPATAGRPFCLLAAAAAIGAETANQRCPSLLRFCPFGPMPCAGVLFSSTLFMGAQRPALSHA